MSDQIPEEFICCAVMKEQSEHCSQHKFDCPDYVVRYKDVTRSFYLDAENAAYEMYFCPWCGKTLPKSLNDERYDILEKLLGGCWEEKDVPEEYRTRAWWNKKDIK